jgi:quinolinate synthase
MKLGDEMQEEVMDGATTDEGKLYEWLHEKLHDVAPDFELREKARLAAEINRLKRSMDAVILCHNYMEPALYHSIADFKGDSLELARAAAKSDAETIVFCGVRFMAETAKILKPKATVLLPALEAGCSLADGITAADVRALKARYPGVPVVTYVNSYADVKAESDICCTSGNAAAVVESLKTDTVIFLPDEYLAKNVAKETGRNVIFPKLDTAVGADVDGAGARARMIGWQARCEVHDKFTVEDVAAVRKQFPDVAVLAHPECRPEVTAVVDFTGSTAAMIRYVEKSTAPRYLLLTECSMGDNVAASHPEKQMLRLCSVRCRHMSSITLENTLESLRRRQHVIDVPEEIANRARRAVERMLAIG